MASISQTFWSKIVQSYAPTILCGLVPLVDHALFTSVTPGLRETYCKEITADEYENGRFVFPVSEPLRAVGIIAEKAIKLGTFDTNATANQQSPKTLQVTGIGGCYAPDDAHDLGTIRFFRPPSWLNNIKSSDFSVGNTTGMSTQKPISTAFTPKPDPDPSLSAGVTKGDDSAKTDQIVEMFRAYAKSLFVSNSLRGRSGSLVGKLRFDIAPGSSVKIHAKYEPFIGSEDALVNELIATVVKVTSTLDAESKEAMTTFEFAYVRTVEENKSDSYSVESHPLFKDSFVGAPLIDELQFGACKKKKS
jgi:hypothetical protein